MVVLIIFSLTGCKNKEDVIVNSNVEELTFESVSDYLLNKDYIPAIMDEPYDESLNSGNVMTLGNDVQRDRIYPEDVDDSTGLIYAFMSSNYDEMLKEINSVVEIFREELETVLPNLDRFNEYIKLVDKDYYFKVVLRGDTIEDGIHFYAIDGNKNTYIQLSNYYIEEKEYIEISISTLNGDSQIITETQTYSNFNDEVLRFINVGIWQFEYAYELFDFYYPVSYIYEYKLNDDGLYELTHLGGGGSGVSNLVTDEIDGSLLNKNVDDFIFTPEYSLSIVKDFLDGSRMRFIIPDHHSTEDSRDDITFLNGDVGVIATVENGQIYRSLVNLGMFEGVKYIDYNMTEYEMNHVKYNGETLVTDSCVVNFEESNGIRIDKYVDDRDSTVTVSFDVLLNLFGDRASDFETCELKVDYDLLLERMVEEYNNIDKTRILDIEFSNFSEAEINEYLLSNFLINNDDLQEILTDFKSTHDYIVPIISAPRKIVVSSSDTLSDIDFYELITVYDDTDGYLNRDQIEIVITEDAKYPYVTIKAIDSSNNYSEFRIWIYTE